MVLSHRLRLAGLGLIGIAGSASALQFTIRIDNIGPQPLSPTVFAATNSNFDMFTSGLAAPLRIERIAEDGNSAQAQSDLMAAETAGDVLDWVVAAGGPITPGGTRTVMLEADTAHRWLQFASMLGMTNDGFIGSGFGPEDSQIDLFNNGAPLTADFTISFLDAWDAGTEFNTELAQDLAAFGNPGVGPAENGVITRPHTGIRGDEAIPLSFNWYGGDIARIRITPVPEPATLAVLGIGAAAVLRRRRR